MCATLIGTVIHWIQLDHVSYEIKPDSICDESFGIYFNVYHPQQRDKLMHIMMTACDKHTHTHTHRASAYCIEQTVQVKFDVEI